MSKSTIRPFLWFDDNAEEATKFYLSIFEDSKLIDVKKRGKKVIATTFRLNGQEFIALNGGDHYKFTPAISLFVTCKNQKEIDYYWNALTKGGKEIQCGWLADRYGLSWQIVPEALEELLWQATPGQKDRVWNALMGMVKIDIAELKQARDAKPAKPTKKVKAKKGVEK